MDRLLLTVGGKGCGSPERAGRRGVALTPQTHAGELTHDLPVLVGQVAAVYTSRPLSVGAEVQPAAADGQDPADEDEVGDQEYPGAVAHGVPLPSPATPAVAGPPAHRAHEVPPIEPISCS